ncbi:Holliday junction ATP-dependent DNA helicase RuvA [bacterium HR25]|nr:Holliday junction ATP-dependent DNA helicase RuvA [bacterium HR25]
MSPIARLRGVVLERGPGWLIVEVGGLGLQVYASAAALSSAREGETVELHTHLVVRDESWALYGFPTREELELFRSLIGVGGVGPRLALALLSALGAPALSDAIARGDADALARTPGVGRKLAGRIVLELRGRLAAEAATPPEQREVLEALLALGYSRDEAREALRLADLPPDAPLEEKLRAVLRRLAR